MAYSNVANVTFTTDAIIPDPSPPTYPGFTTNVGDSSTINHAALWSDVPAGATWSATGLPSGRSIDTSTGLETGTYDTQATYPGIVITCNGVDSNGYTVVVEQQLIAPTWNNPTVSRSDYDSDQPLTQDCSDFNGFPTPALSLETSVPGFALVGTDLQANSAGIGVHVNRVRATNSEGQSDKTVTWTILGTPTPPSYTGFTTNVGQSTPVNHAALWSNVPPGAEWSATGLPSGRSINASTGLETGTYDTEATYPGIVITCSGFDSSGYTVAVEAALEPPVWSTPIPDQQTKQSNLPDPLDVSSNFTGNPVPTLSLSPPVTGFSIAGTTITAEANAPEGINGLVVRATNSEGTADDAFIWEIIGSPSAPDYGNRKSINGQTVSWDATKGWQNVTLTGWTAAGLPTGLTMNDNGTVTGVAGTNGTWANVVITYTDSEGIWSADPFQWDVVDAPPAPEGGAGGMSLNLNLKI